MLNSLSISAGYHQALKLGYAAGGATDATAGRGALLKTLDHREGDVLELGRPGASRQPSAETLLALIEEKVNRNVEQAFPEEEVEPPLSDDYWSPEKTAGRIVEFALKYWEHYSGKSGGENAATLDRFLALVEGAIDQGFGEATSLVSEANGGSIPEKKAGTIAATRERVTALLSEFRETVMARIDGTAAAQAPAEPETAAA